MKKIFSLLPTFFAASLVVVSTSCSDDDDPKSKTDLLASSSWIYDKFTLEIAGQEFPAPDELDACMLDNVLTFSKDGTYKQTAGTDNCSGDETEETGTWKWNSDETVLTITTKDNGTDDTVELTLSNLSDSQLKVLVETFTGDINGDGKIDSQDVESKLYAYLKHK